MSTNESTTNANMDKLIADLKVVVADAEELLRATASQTGDRIVSARAKAEESLKVAKARLMDAQSAAGERVKATARATDEYVHDNPWRVIGSVAVVGLLLGALISRR
jgi:ElaB/YqjD/DUF883 family membrane-anchored ribosome-binding protein